MNGLHLITLIGCDHFTGQVTVIENGSSVYFVICHSIWIRIIDQIFGFRRIEIFAWVSL